MNLIGKILVGVIFVMSIVFMSFAIVTYSTQRHWQDQFKKVDAEKQQVQSQNSKLQTETAQLKDEYERLVAGLNEDVLKLESKNKELAEENNKLGAEVGKYREESEKMCVLATETQTNMAKLQEELLTTRATLAKTETAKYKLFEDLVKANNTARVLSLELVTLKTHYDELKKGLADSRYLLTQLGYGDLAPEAYVFDTPPRVEGTITDMRANGMVEINIGSDDGLLQGHQLHVYRDNEGVQSYLGRIQIVSVKPSKAIGKIMPEYRTGTIMTNDNVKAYLSQITTASL